MFLDQARNREIAQVEGAPEGHLARPLGSASRRELGRGPRQPRPVEHRAAPQGRSGSVRQY